MKGSCQKVKGRVVVRYVWIAAIALGWFVQLSGEGTAQIQDASEEELVKQLADSGVEKRRDAAYELARRRDASDAAITALGKAIIDSDNQVQIQSLTGLARAGKKAELVLPSLIQCLGDREAQVRYRAAAALGAIGAAAIEPLLSYWPSASVESKIAASQALAIIGPSAKAAIPSLRAGLEQKGGLALYAAEALMAISPHDEDLLLTIANHSEPKARSVGIVKLASAGTLSEMGIERLHAAMSDSDTKIREAVVVAIAKSKLQMAEKAAFIESGLVDPEESVRAAAIASILKSELPSEPFSHRIASRMQAADGEVANTLIKAIMVLGKGAKSALPAVMQAAEKTGIDQQLAARSLASFGEGVVPDLLMAIERRPEHGAVFSQALGLIGEPAIGPLTQGLSSPVELVRVSAARALGGMRPMSKTVLQRMTQAMEDPSGQVREVVIGALIAIAKEGDVSKDTAVLAALGKAAQDPSANVRAATMQSLGVMKMSEEQITKLVDLGLHDPSPAVRSSTLFVLGGLPKFLQSRLEPLIGSLSDPDVGVRKNAVTLLAKLDKKGITSEMMQGCVQALRDSDTSVRMAATDSVKALGMTEDSVREALSANLVDDLNLLPQTLEALAGFGGKAAASIPTIAQLVSHEKPAVRIAALNALSAIEKDAHQLVGRLMESLEDENWEVRQCAAAALGKLGPDAKNAVPKLFGMLKNRVDQGFADSALKEINAAPVEAVPMLIEKIDSGERREAFYAVSLLGKIGPPAAESLPKLEAKLAEMSSGGKREDKSREEFRRKFLAEAIAAIKGEAKPK